MCVGRRTGTKIETSGAYLHLIIETLKESCI